MVVLRISSEVTEEAKIYIGADAYLELILL